MIKEGPSPNAGRVNSVTPHCNKTIFHTLPPGTGIEAWQILKGLSNMNTIWLSIDHNNNPSYNFVMKYGSS
jgi:hypothetical protein